MDIVTCFGGSRRVCLLHHERDPYLRVANARGFGYVKEGVLMGNGRVELGEGGAGGVDGE